MEIIEIKCTGTTRCCRQVLLQKMYNKEHPFESIYTILMVPVEYLGYKTLQIYINSIDIGFISKKDAQSLYSFHAFKACSKVRYSKTGKPHYDFYLSGINACEKDYEKSNKQL